jgi:hypothetical protein
MKLLLQLSFVALFVCSCSKKKEKKEPAPKQAFVKTITRTFPVGDVSRASDFVYDEKNRIIRFEFKINGLLFLNTYTYNDQDLIIQANQKRTQISTGNTSEAALEFRYAAGILNEYIENGTAYPVVYVAASKSYNYLTRTFFLDAADNLKKIDYPARNSVTVNYLSDKGPFAIQPAQVALHIFTDNIRRSMDTYTASVDTYAFSKNEISSIKDNDLIVYHFSSIRDAQGNIVQTDVKNDAGNLQYRYMYTYEMR